MANDEASPDDGAVDACSGETCMAISDPLTLLLSVEEESDDTLNAAVTGGASGAAAAAKEGMAAVVAEVVK